MDLKFSTAGYFVKREGIISPDDSLLLLLAGKVVKFYERKSGKYIDTIAGHTREVTSALFHPNDSKCLITSSLDGRIGFWDMRARKYTFFQVSGPVESMICPVGLVRSDILFFSVQKKYGGGRIWSFSISRKKVIEKILKTSLAPKLVSSPSGAFFGAFERSSLTIWPISSKGKYSNKCGISDFIRINHTKTITSLAFCPHDKIVAVGDSTGRITCYHGLSLGKDQEIFFKKQLRKFNDGETVEDLPSITLHWHSTSVATLKFTMDGIRLLSSAKEEVLVIWSIFEGRKTFLPRIGSAICNIMRFNLSTSHFILSGVDNSVYLLDLPNLDFEKIIQGIQRCASSSSESVKNQFINHASHISLHQRNLLAVSAGSAVQIFDYINDKSVTTLEISGKVNDLFTKSIVTHVNFSEDGLILFTVNRKTRNNQSTDCVETLKIWEQISEYNHISYKLVGCCESPHNEQVNALGLSKQKNLYIAFTSGTDGIKLWTRKVGPFNSWSCGTRMKHSSEESVEIGTFSRDGSLLLTASSNICIWCTKYLEKVTILTDSKFNSKICSFANIGDFLLSASSVGVIGWDVLSLKKNFILMARCKNLQTDPFGKLFLSHMQLSKKITIGLVIFIALSHTFPGQVFMMEKESALILCPTSRERNEENIPNVLIGTSDCRILSAVPPVLAKKVINSAVFDDNQFTDRGADIVISKFKSTLVRRVSASCFAHVASFQLPQLSLACNEFIDKMVIS